MRKLSITGLLLLLTSLPIVNAAEITTCIIDSTVKKNPRVYFFPITSTELRCDHVIGKANVTLSDLYRNDWKLIQVINPIIFDQKESRPGYSPVIIYLERQERPVVPDKTEVTRKPSPVLENIDPEKPAEESQGGGFFDWVKVEPEEESSDE